jgi:hypothetical protein
MVSGIASINVVENRPGTGIGREQLGHRLDLHVAVLQLPLVIGLQQHGPEQLDDRRLAREDTDYVHPLMRGFCLVSHQRSTVSPSKKPTDNRQLPGAIAREL